MVAWVARLGAISVEQLGRRFDVGRSVAYERVKQLVGAGLLERTETLSGDPTLISATKDGITYAGLGLPMATVRVGEVHHWLACADVAIELERRFGPANLLTDREVRFEEQRTGKPLASVKLGETRNGYWRRHYPDLIVTAGELPIAYEVELTPKSQRRLKAILRAWRRARHIERCIYLCPPGPTQQTVENVIKRIYAEDEVEVIELRRGTLEQMQISPPPPSLGAT